MPSPADRFFPFHRLNLTKNPFGTLTAAERIRVTVPSPPVRAALDDGFENLILLGPKGVGKSTALHYILNELTTNGLTTAYERLPNPYLRPVKTDLTPLDAFALDEMQRIAPWAALRLFREMRGKHLLVGSHVNHVWAFRARGRAVTVIRLVDGASEVHLAAVLQQRLAAFVKAPSQPPAISFTPDAVSWLWARYGADQRAITFFLYDVLQSFQRPGTISAADLAAYAR
ncbi:MAG: hypothetical protein AAF125_12125 [Chloroflexota bacterium]